jgi:selenocysteine-specific elongation factor
VRSSFALQVGHTLLSRAAFEGVKIYVADLLKDFHRRNPLTSGMNKEALREDLQLGLRPEVFAAVLESLIAERKIESSAENVRIAGQSVVMKDEESESKRAIELAFESAGLKVPPLKEVLAGLKIDRVRAQRIVTLLLREKVLVKLSEDLVFHGQALERLRQMVKAQKAAAPRMDVARFKDLAGVSRKYAIPLLEYLDRERITRRVGDERLIL